MERLYRGFDMITNRVHTSNQLRRKQSLKFIQFISTCGAIFTAFTQHSAFLNQLYLTAAAVMSTAFNGFMTFGTTLGTIVFILFFDSILKGNNT